MQTTHRKGQFEDLAKKIYSELMIEGKKFRLNAMKSTNENINFIDFHLHRRRDADEVNSHFLLLLFSPYSFSLPLTHCDHHHHNHYFPLLISNTSSVEHTILASFCW